jgi:Sec-independent protein translocase protein TatA
MGGFHLVDILIVAGIALAIFGPKTLQSWARSAGKGVAQAKDMKDKLMSDLPMDDIANITDSIPQVPLNSRQAVEMLLASDDEDEKKAKDSEKTSTKKAEEKKGQEAKVSET